MTVISGRRRKKRRRRRGTENDMDIQGALTADQWDIYNVTTSDREKERSEEDRSITCKSMAVMSSTTRFITARTLRGSIVFSQSRVSTLFLNICRNIGKVSNSSNQIKRFFFFKVRERRETKQ